uniref:Uncharacterized protein n=1 Tax=Salix viminalis TaxID=40686 RepID=A0A6N2KAW8_SALVM
MRHLKLLQITGAHLTGSYSLLPRELIWLCWLECPLKSLPSDFHLSDLVILDMQKSKVRKLWKGTKCFEFGEVLQLKESSRKHGQLKISSNSQFGERCENLLSISEFTSNLASLSIGRCTAIERVIAPLRSKRFEYWSYGECPNLIEAQDSNLYEDEDLRDNNLSEDEDIRDYFKRSVIQSNGATLKDKDGFEFFDKKAVLNFGRNSTKLSWINRDYFSGFELESLQGVEEVELNVKVRGSSDAPKCWVEKCGVHLIMVKEKASTPDDWKQIFEYASTPDNQRMQSILIRELQEGKIIGYKEDEFFDHFDKNNS